MKLLAASYYNKLYGISKERGGSCFKLPPTTLKTGTEIVLELS